MTSGLDVTNRVLVAAFRAALLHQSLIAVLILATLAIAWASVREWLPGLAGAVGRGPVVAEHRARTLLRTGFGNDVAYGIDPSGRTRTVLNMDQGPGSSSSCSSFAVDLAHAAEQALAAAKAS